VVAAVAAPVILGLTCALRHEQHSRSQATGAATAIRRFECRGLAAERHFAVAV
jgi:hypothetical protein